MECFCAVFGAGPTSQLFCFLLKQGPGVVPTMASGHFRFRWLVVITNSWNLAGSTVSAG